MRRKKSIYYYTTLHLGMIECFLRSCFWYSFTPYFSSIKHLYWRPSNRPIPDRHVLNRHSSAVFISGLATKQESPLLCHHSLTQSLLLFISRFVWLSFLTVKGKDYWITLRWRLLLTWRRHRAENNPPFKLLVSHPPYLHCWKKMCHTKLPLTLYIIHQALMENSITTDNVTVGSYCCGQEKWSSDIMSISSRGVHICFMEQIWPAVA